MMSGKTAQMKKEIQQVAKEHPDRVVVIMHPGGVRLPARNSSPPPTHLPAADPYPTIDPKVDPLVTHPQTAGLQPLDQRQDHVRYLLCAEIPLSVLEDRARVRTLKAVFIDEAHFYADIERSVQQLLSHGVDVYIAGLVWVHPLLTFGPMANLAAEADRIIFLKGAQCQCVIGCAKRAVASMPLAIPNFPTGRQWMATGFEADKVGGSDKYGVYCRMCAWTRLNWPHDEDVPMPAEVQAEEHPPLLGPDDRPDPLRAIFTANDGPGDWKRVPRS